MGWRDGHCGLINLGLYVIRNILIDCKQEGSKEGKEEILFLGPPLFRGSVLGNIEQTREDWPCLSALGLRPYLFREPLVKELKD